MRNSRRNANRSAREDDDLFLKDLLWSEYWFPWGFIRSRKRGDVFQILSTTLTGIAAVAALWQSVITQRQLYDADVSKTRQALIERVYRSCQLYWELSPNYHFRYDKTSPEGQRWRDDIAFLDRRTLPALDSTMRKELYARTRSNAVEFTIAANTFWFISEKSDQVEMGKALEYYYEIVSPNVRDPSLDTDWFWQKLAANRYACDRINRNLKEWAVTKTIDVAPVHFPTFRIVDVLPPNAREPY